MKSIVIPILLIVSIETNGQRKLIVEDTNKIQLSLEVVKSAGSSAVVFECRIINLSQDTIYLNSLPGGQRQIQYDFRKGRTSNEIYIGFYESYSQGIIVNKIYSLRQCLPKETIEFQVILDDRISKRKVSHKEIYKGLLIIQLSYVKRPDIAALLCKNELLCNSIEGAALFGVVNTSTTSLQY